MAHLHTEVRTGEPPIMDQGPKRLLPLPLDRAILETLWMDRGVGRGICESLLEDVLKRPTPHLDQGFAACSSLFGEESA
jgi:hypothetical protein